MTGIQLVSSAFGDRSRIPDRYAHDGDNVSPALRWSDLPAAATELVLMCSDPDAPGGTFLHWLVTGIDPASAGVDEGRTPLGGRAWPNGFGDAGWGGPMPPVGDRAHRYIFQMFALGEPIALPPEPSADDVHRHVDHTALASGATVGLYQR
jgi:hypothetical protein